MEGFKDSKGKLPLHTVFTKQFPKALIEIAKRSEYGHNQLDEKDTDYMNFKRVPNAIFQYQNSRMRHNMCLGEEHETYFDHLVAATWNGLAEIELTLDENFNGMDFDIDKKVKNSTQKEELDEEYDFVKEIHKVLNSSKTIEHPFVELTYEEFLEKYKPLEDEKSSGFGTFNNYKNALECTGNDSTRIWSLIQCPYDEMFIYPGWHTCDNIGYVVTEKEWEHENIQVDYNDNVSIMEAISDAKLYIETRGYKLDIVKLISDIIGRLDNFDKDKGYISTPRLYHATIDYIESITGEDLEDDVLDEIRNYYYE
jgi:hypothetical protein